jgi:hypothetical protein
MDSNIVLIIGCIFPALSWITFVGSFISEKVTGKHSSPVFIPIIGPVLINLWSLELSQPLWAYILPWILDLGTLSFAYILPGLFKETWQFSKFTKLMTVVSQLDNQTVKLSLQKNNSYIIRYSWSREEGELGILATNDFGTFEKVEDSKFLLTSHTDKIRILEKINDEYHCIDKESEGDLNLNGYVFT